MISKLVFIFTGYLVFFFLIFTQDLTAHKSDLLCAVFYVFGSKWPYRQNLFFISKAPSKNLRPNPKSNLKPRSKTHAAANSKNRDVQRWSQHCSREPRSPESLQREMCEQFTERESCRRQKPRDRREESAEKLNRRRLEQFAARLKLQFQFRVSFLTQKNGLCNRVANPTCKTRLLFAQWDHEISAIPAISRVSVAIPLSFDSACVVIGIIHSIRDYKLNHELDYHGRNAIRHIYTTDFWPAAMIRYLPLVTV